MHGADPGKGPGDAAALASCKRPPSPSQPTWIRWLSPQRSQPQQLDRESSSAETSDEKIPTTGRSDAPNVHGGRGSYQFNGVNTASSDQSTQAGLAAVRDSAASAAPDADTAMRARQQEAAALQSSEGGNGAPAADSLGGRGWWLPNLAAWLWPGGPAQTDPAQSRGSDDKPAGKQGGPAGEVGGAGSAKGKGINGALSKGFDGAPEARREQSQTPTDRRLSESEIRISSFVDVLW